METDPPQLRDCTEAEGHIAKNSPLCCWGICDMLSSQAALRNKSAGAGRSVAAVALRRLWSPSSGLLTLCLSFSSKSAASHMPASLRGPHFLKNFLTVNGQLAGDLYTQNSSMLLRGPKVSPAHHRRHNGIVKPTRTPAPTSYIGSGLT